MKTSVLTPKVIIWTLAVIVVAALVVWTLFFRHDGADNAAPAKSASATADSATPSQSVSTSASTSSTPARDGESPFTDHGADTAINFAQTALAAWQSDPSDLAAWRTRVAAVGDIQFADTVWRATPGSFVIPDGSTLDHKDTVGTNGNAEQYSIISPDDHAIGVITLYRVGWGENGVLTWRVEGLDITTPVAGQTAPGTFALAQVTRSNALQALTNMMTISAGETQAQWQTKLGQFVDPTKAPSDVVTNGTPYAGMSVEVTKPGPPPTDVDRITPPTSQGPFTVTTTVTVTYAGTGSSAQVYAIATFAWSDAIGGYTMTAFNIPPQEGLGSPGAAVD